MKDVVRQEPRINLSVATKPIIPEEGGGGHSLTKGAGRLLVSLSGVNFGFWS